MRRLLSSGCRRWPAAAILAVSLVLASGAGAADRHVYLDTDGDGALNDCPNPAHNAKGTGNTDPLQFCQSSGARNGKIIGTASGRVTAAQCLADPGGAVGAVTSGVVADVDGDGVPEPVYGHPQACVWNMAKSDSCEVHAGTYRRAGAVCDENCANHSAAGLNGTLGACDKFDCFQASVVAFGDGPNLDGTGYGTASQPGYLRGAVMNGVVDSWDPNGDKNPADGAYPAILSGDSNGNGAFDITACSGGSCTGDAFYGVIIGCGGPTYGRHYCRATPESGTTYVRIDSDADGIPDRNVGQFAYNQREVHHLRLRDLVFTRYNGGNGGQNGSRPKTATIDLNGGDGSTDGLAVEHIYLHGNDFTYGLDDISPDRQENEGYTETHWAAFNDHVNSGCTSPTVIRDSFLVQNNARLLNFDCSPNFPCGCEVDFHGNRVVVDVDPSKVPTYVDPTGKTRVRSIAVGYYKNIGANPQQHRIRNNEFIIKHMGTTRGYFMDLQSFGDAEGSGTGELWVYGNLFRHDPAISQKMSRFWQGFCDGGGSANGGTASWRLYLVNNTFDMDVSLGDVCIGQPGEILVERNNAYLRMTDLTLSGAGTIVRGPNAQSTSSASRTAWFDPGSYSPGNPGYHGGLANYRARAAGPLDGTGSCDPDGDGQAGMDYDWNGTRDTVWVDLAGQQVDCSGPGAVMDIGAIQSSSAGPVCGNGVREGSEACDGADLGGATCASLGLGSGTLACTGQCAYNTSGCSGAPDTTPPANVNGLRRTDVKP